MNTLKHYLSVAICSFRLSLQNQFEYPIYLLSWVIINPIQYLTGALLLKVLADKFQNIAGWAFPQIAFVYGLALLSHGFQVIFFIQTWSLGRLVTEGEFDRMLVRPMNVFFQFIIRNINLVGCTDLIPGSIIFLYACNKIGFIWDFINIISVIIVIIGGMLIRASIYNIVSSIAFWTYRSRSIFSVFYYLVQQGTLYPISIYPRVFQIFLTFIIPIGFISFYPSCDFLKLKSELFLPTGLIIWTPIIGVLLFIITNTVFNLGLKNYESTGS